MATGRLAATDLIGGVAQSVYQCPTDKYTSLAVNICNRGTTTANVTIAVTSSQSSFANAEYIEFKTELPAKNSLERTSIVIDSTKYLTVLSTTSNVSVVAYGIEVGSSVSITPITTQSDAITPSWITASTFNWPQVYTLEASHPGTLTYTITSGALPAGLSLNSTTGIISGTPTTIGNTGSPTIRATAPGGNNASRSFSITTTAASAPTRVATGTLDPGAGGGGGGGDLFAFTTHTFTTAGTVGRRGPTLATLQSTYSAASWSSNLSYFYEGRAQGYQVFKIPSTGNYQITVAGARGQSSASGFAYGRGAILRATIALTQGNLLEMVVGQVPGTTGSTNPSNSHSGGGGGTFIAYAGTSTPIMVAGGGAGTYGSWHSNQSYTDGQTRTSPIWTGFNYSPAVSGGGGGPVGNEGTGGNGGLGYHAGGGGGFLTSGRDYSGQSGSSAMATDPTGQQFTHGASFVGGSVSTASGPFYALGGNATTLTSEGGFGGGGGGHSGNNTGGGGGGYSGGVAGQTSLGGSWLSGNGGGSFIISGAVSVATSDGQYEGSSSFNGAITNLGSYNDGSGYIIITKL